MMKKVGFSDNYLTETHTARHFRDEHFIPQLLPRDTYEAWKKAGSKSALDLAKERVHEILANHQPRTLDPTVEHELDGFRQMVTTRPMEEFYAYEAVEKQDLENL
jgi:trimethylamine--corrinoid protein Co-methyltransferase